MIATYRSAPARAGDDSEMVGRQCLKDGADGSFLPLRAHTKIEFLTDDGLRCIKLCFCHLDSQQEVVKLLGPEVGGGHVESRVSYWKDNFSMSRPYRCPACGALRGLPHAGGCSRMNKIWRLA